MNNRILLKIFIIALALGICGCEKPNTNKTKLIYENGDQKVEIKILNENEYLEIRSIRTNFVLTNIEPNTFSVYGIGIRILGMKKGVMKTEINVSTDYLKTDTLNIDVRFGNKPEENYEFKVPIKKTV